MSDTCPTTGPCEAGRHERTRPGQRRLLLALALTGGFLGVEVVGGVLTGSLALLSDAGHMLADVFALALALGALRLASLPATPAKSYGFYRIEILSALANGVVLCVVAVVLAHEAWERFFAPRPIATGGMIAVAAAGLAVNLVAALALRQHGHGHNLNLRGAYLHVLGDLLSSVGVLVGAIAIAVTGEVRVDAVLSAVIGVVILWSAQRLVRDAVDVLLEAYPKGLRPPEVEAAITRTPGVIDLHDLHIWSLTTGVEALSAHVRVHPQSLPDTDRILETINRELLSRFGIAHTTIQVESTGAAAAGAAPPAVSA